MSIPKEAWGWWGDEGGHRLDVKRLKDGRVEVTVTSASAPPVSVTLANFRVPQLKEWLREEGEDDAAFIKGVESVTCIRCSEHYDVPLINTNESGGGECGACVRELADA